MVPTEAKTACHPNSGVQSACCINTYLSSIHKSVQQSYMSVSLQQVAQHLHKTATFIQHTCTAFPATPHTHTCIFSLVSKRNFQLYKLLTKCTLQEHSSCSVHLPMTAHTRLPTPVALTILYFLLWLVKVTKVTMSVGHLALTLFGEMVSWTDQ